MTKSAKVATVLVVFATVVSEVVAIAVYRHSTDGQTGALSGIIVLYGLLAIGGVWLLDAAARRLRKRRSRT